MSAASETGSVRSLDGTALCVQATGDGEPLLLVHGTACTKERWAGVLPRFAEHYRVYTFDRRGRGGSGDGAVYSLEREFEDVACVADSIGAPVRVLAHSYGAVCALGAVATTQRIRQLVLYEPPIGVTTPGSPAVDVVEALSEAGKFDEALFTFFRDVVEVPAAALAALRASASWPGRLAIVPTIARELRALQVLGAQPEHLAAVRLPTVLVHGALSAAPFLRAIAFLAAGIPGAQVVELPGQHHQAMDTAPELFIDFMLAALRGDAHAAGQD